MGIVRMGVPERLLLFLREKFGINIFVETGTFKGDTSFWASKYFKNVFTIELSEELYSNTKRKYKDVQNITFIFGNSEKELNKIVNKLQVPAIFWLDAHHCSLNTAGKGEIAPILKEIHNIVASKLNHIILIDDARLFLAPPPDPHPIDEYPDIFKLLKKINKRKKYYSVIYDDVIICVPEFAKKIVSQFYKKEITIIDKNFWEKKKGSLLNKIFHLIETKIKYYLKIIINIIKQKFANKKMKLFKNNFNVIKKENDLKGRFICKWEDRYPCIDDVTTNTEFNRHYVLHPVWAIRVLLKIKPKVHYDISSSIRFVTQLSCIMPVKHYDYRPPLLKISNLKCEYIELNNLQFKNNSIKSLSCMHVVEHVGLGRYGEAIDYDGDIKAARELTRVLSVNGNLLFVVPVGKPRIEFNAHRIYSYNQVLDLFPSLMLKEFVLIPDLHEDGDLVYNTSEIFVNSQNHGCGCFWFQK